jgi:hypothetical protein
MTSFLLLNPGFFFDASGPAQKAVLVPFFWGGFMPPPPKLFFNHRGISVGPLSESKILKMSVHVRKPQRPWRMSVKYIAVKLFGRFTFETAV